MMTALQKHALGWVSQNFIEKGSDLEDDILTFLLLKALEMQIRFFFVYFTTNIILKTLS